jgi:hypothetical protein
MYDVVPLQAVQLNVAALAAEAARDNLLGMSPTTGPTTAAAAASALSLQRRGSLTGSLEGSRGEVNMVFGGGGDMVGEVITFWGR